MSMLLRVSGTKQRFPRRDPDHGPMRTWSGMTLGRSPEGMLSVMTGAQWQTIHTETHGNRQHRHLEKGYILEGGEEFGMQSKDAFDDENGALWQLEDVACLLLHPSCWSQRHAEHEMMSFVDFLCLIHSLALSLSCQQRQSGLSVCLSVSLSLSLSLPPSLSLAQCTHARRDLGSPGWCQS